MNKKDAIKLMLEGKKVKQKEWIDRAYLYMNESGEILNCDNSLDNLNLYSDKDWMVVDERKEVSRQMDYLKDLYRTLFKENGDIRVPCYSLDCGDCPLEETSLSNGCLQTRLGNELIKINKKWKLDN